jgi:hypothetical protein
MEDEAPTLLDYLMAYIKGLFIGSEYYYTITTMEIMATKFPHNIGYFDDAAFNDMLQTQSAHLIDTCRPFVEGVSTELVSRAYGLLCLKSPEIRWLTLRAVFTGVQTSEVHSPSVGQTSRLLRRDHGPL